MMNQSVMVGLPFTAHVKKHYYIRIQRFPCTYIMIQTPY